MPVDRSMPVYPPSKGEDILASWGDQVSEHVVQRFATAAERDAKWANPPKGALCVTTDTPRPKLWVHDGTNWVSGGGSEVGFRAFTSGTVALPTTGTTEIPFADNAGTGKGTAGPGNRVNGRISIGAPGTYLIQQRFVMSTSFGTPSNCQIDMDVYAYGGALIASLGAQPIATAFQTCFVQWVVSTSDPAQPILGNELGWRIYNGAATMNVNSAVMTVTRVGDVDA